MASGGGGEPARQSSEYFLNSLNKINTVVNVNCNTYILGARQVQLS
jgi:hypothetical protein